MRPDFICILGCVIIRIGPVHPAQPWIIKSRPVRIKTIRAIVRIIIVGIRVVRIKIRNGSIYFGKKKKSLWIFRNLKRHYIICIVGNSSCCSVIAGIFLYAFGSFRIKIIQVVGQLPEINILNFLLLERIYL